MIEPKFEAAVGMSRKWDAREAGREVAETAIKKLSRPPDFFLLFSTIHYEKHGGFQEFLNGVWDVLPKGTPLIGGTVAGFMNNYGCYTHGATGLSVSGEGIFTISDVVHNTKRSPIRAANKVISKIKPYYNKKDGLLLEFISGPTIPELPFLGKMNLIKSRLTSEFLLKFGIRATSLLGYGIAKDSIILREIKKNFPEMNIIGGATMDDGKLMRNYQFWNNSVFENSLTFLYIHLKNKFEMEGVLELVPTNISFDVNKTSNGNTVLEKLDNMPAVDAFFKKINKSDYPLKSKDLLYRATMSYPIVSEDGKSSTGIGAIYGKGILLGHPINTKKLFLLRGSGHHISDATKMLKNTLEGKKLVLGSMCETCVDILGRKLYDQKTIVDDMIQDTPYLFLYFGGEHYAYKDELLIRSHSLNVLGVS